MGELKAMKLGFLLGYDLFQSKIKALNFEFYRYDWGPFAKEFYDSTEHYRRSNWAVLDEDSHLVAINDAGVSLAVQFKNEVLRLPENEAIYDSMHYVANQYGELTQGEIMDRVYAMKVYTLENPNQLQTIANIKHHRHFTRKLDSGEAKAALYIPEEWQISLSMSRNDEFRHGMRTAIKDVQAGREHPLEQLFSHAV
jgi:hypothetical protein